VSSRARLAESRSGRRDRSVLTHLGSPQLPRTRRGPERRG
jgi:hypothetical protein